MAYTDIDKSDDYFNTVLYAGDDTSNRNITGFGFQPDFLWQKGRLGALNHYLFDVVRGNSSLLRSNLTAAEYTSTSGFNGFISDGFDVSQVAGVEMNSSSYTYANWCWKAGGTGVSNTDGSITSTVSASTTSGFSVVSFTGTNASATVGHGLGAVPKVIIVKCRTTVDNWAVYTAMTGNTSKLRLNGTNATITGVPSWDSTTPTSSVFSLGADTEVNNTSATIAYCFTDVKGFSKFGSYTGNGSAGNGPFIYTGFKPAWVLIKWIDGTEIWQVWDSKRDTYNVQQRVLAPNSSNAEDTNGSGGYLLIDSLSNGFKVRGNPVSNAINGSGQNYIYMAFAESPFTTSTGIPTTAR